MFCWDMAVILAELPEYIIIFAVVIILNSISTSICWILYTILPAKVYGKKYETILFIIDAIFDATYALFPLFIVNGINFNSFGILSVNSDGFKFISIFVPLLLLTTKLYYSMYDTMLIINIIKIEL